MGENEYMSKSVNQVKYALINAYTHQRIYPTCSTSVENIRQIGVFLQNKANFRNGQMNINSFITKDYEKNGFAGRRKNKANSKPNKANFG